MKKEAILRLVNEAASSKIGGFAGKFDLGDKFLLAATDGVGSKLVLAKKQNDFSGIGQDLVAMCVNDIVVHGGKPLFFLDYYGCNYIDEVQFKCILESISKACKIAGCELIGGETAEMPFTYGLNDYDLVGFAVGIVDKDKYLTKEGISTGDIILGLASDGIHSNGFTAILERTEGIDKQKLLTPTRIYVRSCLNVLAKTDNIKALAHITGGGLIENIPRVLPKELSFKLKNMKYWPSLFHQIQKSGNFTEQEMLETFNCGIGMAVIVDKNNVDEVSDLFIEEGENIDVIGEVTSYG